MKIGLLTRYLAVGEETDSGIGQHFRILADALAAAGNQVHVVLLTTQPEAMAAALGQLRPVWTHELVALPQSRLADLAGRRSWPLQVLLDNLRHARAARRAMTLAAQRLGLEIIETHTYGAPACLLLRITRRPRIVSRVSTTSRMVNAIGAIHSRVLGWQEQLERHAIRRSDALVTHTLQHRDLVCTQEGLEPARFAIVPHGLPDPGPPPDFRPRNPLGQVEFLFVGRFESRKGIDVLLAAIPQVAATCPHASFTLAGSHGDGTDWAAFARTHPDLATTRVQVTGRVSAAELAVLYRRCSVLVAPSRYESFGLIYPEAMAHGKPVIGCTAGGIPEVVTHGVTGLLVPPGESRSLANSMIRLANDAALREALGTAGRRDFETRFSAATLADASVALYRQILGQSTPS